MDVISPDLRSVTLKTLYKVAHDIPSRPDVHPAWLAMGVRDRLAALASEVGPMSDRRQRLDKIDSDRPFGPGNLCWTMPDESLQPWSPTLQCEACGSWSTKITATEPRRARRRHHCRDCGHRMVSWASDIEAGSQRNHKPRHRVPRAECPDCGSGSTRVIATRQQHGVRRHACDCGHKFNTSMEQ